MKGESKMSKKMKFFVIITLLGTAVYIYRSDIKSFIGSLIEKEHWIENNYNNDKSSYNFYYSDYKSKETYVSSNWNIYKEN